MTSDEIEDDIRETSAYVGGIGQRKTQITFQAGVFHMLLSHVDPTGFGLAKARDNRFLRASQLMVHRIKDMKATGTSTSDPEAVLSGMRLGSGNEAGGDKSAGTQGAWRSASPLSQNTDLFATAALRATHADSKSAAVSAGDNAPPGDAPRETPTLAGEPEAGISVGDHSQLHAASNNSLQEVDLATPKPAESQGVIPPKSNASPLGGRSGKKSQVVPLDASSSNRERTAAEEFGIDDAQSVASTAEPTEDDLM
jgi:hypothetical protein